jgi:hypothetical protein
MIYLKILIMYYKFLVKVKKFDFSRSENDTYFMMHGVANYTLYFFFWW